MWAASSVRPPTETNETLGVVRRDSLVDPYLSDMKSEDEVWAAAARKMSMGS